MKTSKPRATYHHGDLRAALLTAARTLLDEGGVPALTLREVARRTGVTPAATYRHFADKEALLVALAVQGFEEFNAVMRAAQERHPGATGKAAAQTSAHAFAQMGVAYVQFAVERPGLFRLMFGPAVADRSRSPELLATIAASMALFESGQKRSARAKAFDPVAALQAWATVHGLATLAIDGMLPGYDPVALAQALARLPRTPR